MAIWKSVGTLIKENQTMPVAWTDLDLSAWVGTQRVWALLFIHPDTGNDNLSFRPNGDTDNWLNTNVASQGWGVFGVSYNSAGSSAVAFVMTDENGVVEWKSNTANGYDMTLIGYVEGITYSGADLYDGSLSATTWKELDASAVFSEVAIALLKDKANAAFAAGNVHITRPHGDTVNDWVCDQANRSHNTNKLEWLLIDQANALLAISNSGGKLELYSSAATDADIDLLAYVTESDGFSAPESGEEVVFTYGAPPASWTDLNLSDAIGAQESLVFIMLEHNGTLSNAYSQFREKGSDYGCLTGHYSVGSCLVENNRFALVVVNTDSSGIVEWQSAAVNIELTVLGYIATNVAPTFSNKTPTGATEKPYVQIGFSVSDVDGQVDQSTIDVDIVKDPAGSPVTYNAIIDGQFQEGYDGTIVANATNGYDVTITEHPLLHPDDYRIDASADDDLGETGSDNWSFTVSSWTPALVSARAIARRTLQITWDIPVRCRALTVLSPSPADRYTAVDWTGAGGESDDAQNPGVYSITRPSDGNLDGPGEAVDLLATHGTEADEYYYDSSGVRYSYRVNLTVDFEMTARADYEVSVGQVASEYNDSVADDLSFVGFVASHVQRNTLTFFDSLAEYHRRMDREGTGELELFLTIWQEVWNRVLEDTDAFFWDLCDIDKARPEFLDNILYDLGNPFRIDLTTNQKRKLAAVMVQIYREKGTCQGIVNVVQFFVGVTLSGCTSPWEGSWRLSDGTAGSPNPGTGGPYNLSDSDGTPGTGAVCKLGPGTSGDVWSFQLVSPITLTQAQKDLIEKIAEYMKPAACIYLGVIEP